MSEVNLSELMEMDAETDVARDTSLKTGVNVGDVPKLTKKDADTRPNAVRWVFNPFAVIDLTNESAAFSVPFLRNVIFNKIESIPTRSHTHKSFDWNALPGPGRSDAEYDRIDRTSYQQAGDLTSRHAEKGVQVLAKLFDATEEDAAELNTLLFGSEIPCKEDIHHDNFPCPVLPNLLEVLQQNANEAIRVARQQEQGAEADLIKSTAEEIRDAIGRAIKFARASISDAQARFLDEKNPHRKFSPAEERCFIALGEEVPDQLPLITRKAAAGVGQGIDSAALGRGIGEGLAAQGVTLPSVAVAEAPTVVGATASEIVEKISFEVTDADLDAAANPKKGKGK